MAKSKHIRKKPLKPPTIQVRIARELDDRVAERAASIPCFKLQLFNKFIEEGLAREASK